MIPDQFIQDLLSKVDIVDTIDKHVALKRAGANYLARCPFHEEKSASFTVSPSKQFYHCFGCGAHGSAITFLMHYQGAGFVEVVHQLSEHVGMTVPTNSKSVESKKVRDLNAKLFDILQATMNFYRQKLKSSEKAIEFLKERGLTGEVAARFGLGFAPKGWHNLTENFPNYRNEDLEAVGLVIDDKKGGYYDRFRNRITFPIFNQRNEVVGFGGRSISADLPKYLNSPETNFFHKGKELYGFAQAQAAIRRHKKVLVVEGYMDVVALSQFGIEFVVATLGTATTEIQIKMLLRQSDQLFFCFDGDQAGRRAAWRALENSLPLLIDGKQISFLFLPDGHDPDSFVRSNGKETFLEGLNKSIPLSEFLYRELTEKLDFSSVEGKATFLKQSKALLSQIKAPLFSLMLRKRLAELTGLPRDELEQRLELPKNVKKKRKYAETVRTAPRVIRKLIEIICLQPAFIPLINSKELSDLSELSNNVASSLEWNFLFKLIDIFDKQGSIGSLGEHFKGTEYQAISESMETGGFKWSFMDTSELETEFSGALNQCLRQLKKSKYQLLIAKSELTDNDKIFLREFKER